MFNKYEDKPIESMVWWQCCLVAIPLICLYQVVTTVVVKGREEYGLDEKFSELFHPQDEIGVSLNALSFL